MCSTVLCPLLLEVRWQCGRGGPGQASLIQDSPTPPHQTALCSQVNTKGREMDSVVGESVTTNKSTTTENLIKSQIYILPKEWLF